MDMLANITQKLPSQFHDLFKPVIEKANVELGNPPPARRARLNETGSSQTGTSNGEKPNPTEATVGAAAATSNPAADQEHEQQQQQQPTDQSAGSGHDANSMQDLPYETLKNIVG